MAKNTIIGIDLAKTVFQIGVMSGNKIISNKRVNRRELKLFMANHQPPLSQLKPVIRHTTWYESLKQWDTLFY